MFDFVEHTSTKNVVSLFFTKKTYPVFEIKPLFLRPGLSLRLSPSSELLSLLSRKLEGCSRNPLFLGPALESPRRTIWSNCERHFIGIEIPFPLK